LDPPWSLMQSAYEYLKRGEGAAALPWAKQAVAVAPNAFPARKALGQALLENGDVDGAIAELLTGIKLAAQRPGRARAAAPLPNWCPASSPRRRVRDCFPGPRARPSAPAASTTPRARETN